MTIGRLSAQAVQFISLIVLARLLSPSAYGVIAIVWSFTGFAGLLTDLGFATSLVQAKVLTDSDTSTAFYLNVILSVACAAITIALSHPIAELFGQPSLTGLLRLASLMFLVSLTMVPQSLLEREMRFAFLGAIDFTLSIIGYAVSIACAADGMGAKSLVIGPLCQCVIASIVTLCASRWYPRARPSMASARRLFSFGGPVSLFNIGGYWARNGDNLLVGGFVGARALGFYNRAYLLMTLPVTQVGIVIGRVLLPVFSMMQDDRERLRSAVLRILQTTSFLIFPLALGLAACARNLVIVAFGARWAGSTTMTSILATAVLPQIPMAVVGMVSLATGRTRLLSTWGNLVNLGIVIAAAIGVLWGAEGVAIAFTIDAFVSMPLMFRQTDLTINLRTRDFLVVASTPLALSLAMAAVVVAIGLFVTPELGRPATLALQVIGGAVSYAGLAALFAPSLVGEIKSLRG